MFNISIVEQASVAVLRDDARHPYTQPLLAGGR